MKVCNANGFVMKAILISIKPEWVAKILNGEKTIEIRKSMPKCDLPIDVYIYCTKGKYEMGKFNSDKKYHEIRDDCSYAGGWLRGLPNETVNGKVVAKFTLNQIERFDVPYPAYFSQVEKALKHITDNSCLTLMELHHYLKNETGYAWHIDNLEIFDEPKELNDFYKVGKSEYMKNYKPTPAVLKVYKKYGGLARLMDLNVEMNRWRLTKAPQNFCYVEVE